jgi:ribosome recycling factor
MDVSDVKGLQSEVKKRMDAVLEHVRRELAGVRTGRASVNLLDSVQVEAWGSLMPLNQVATLSVPESTMIVATPFDPTLMGAIEKAIRAANLGLNPSNDGKVVRVPLPPLTEDRRKELSKLVHKQAEEGRNSVRQIRRDANDRLKKLLKDHAISEDDERRGLDDVQKITDQHIGTIDDMQKKKDAELLNK